jgi:5-methylcytosine-specific restriction protein A
MCLAEGRATAATVADHLVPYRGDPELFWGGELQSLCATCHSLRKQSQEKGDTEHLAG